MEDKNKSFLPWFIQSVKLKNDTELFLKLESVDTREAAIKLAQKEVWLPETDFKKFAAKSSPLSLLGYMIIDGDRVLGEIQEVIEQPHQLLCRLVIDSKEVLVPLNEEFLVDINHRQKQVKVSLPDGLLDIYL